MGLPPSHCSLPRRKTFDFVHHFGQFLEFPASRDRRSRLHTKGATLLAGQWHPASVRTATGRPAGIQSGCWTTAARARERCAGTASAPPSTPSCASAAGAATASRRCCSATDATMPVTWTACQRHGPASPRCGSASAASGLSSRSAVGQAASGRLCSTPGDPVNRGAACRRNLALPRGAGSAVWWQGRLPGHRSMSRGSATRCPTSTRQRVEVAGPASWPSQHVTRWRAALVSQSRVTTPT